MHSGKVAVVTGGGRGIGKSTALELAGKGADVAIIYGSDEKSAAGTVEEILALGVRSKAYQCDVRSFQDTKKTVTDILSDFGGVDILINNAGVTKDSLTVTMGEENYDLVMDTCLKGSFNMIRHTYTNFLRRRWGRIVNISSVAGLMGNPGQANYASAKAGLIGLTKTVAKELGSRGVTCNAVAPGFIQSDMTDALSEKSMEASVSAIPAGRMGSAWEVAKAVSFLASADAAYITGEVLRVDGGICI